MQKESIHGTWSSRWTFILAATGAAVGLGNIWKFPYIAGENGGGAFVLVYLVCIAMVGVPIMIAEVLLGRRGRQNPIGSLKVIAQESGASAVWQGLGVMGVVTGLLIMSFYSVIAGWALHYVFTTAVGSYTAITAGNAGGAFNQLLANPALLLGWHTLFSAMTFAVVAGGISKGLGSVAKYMMPFLFLALAVGIGAFGAHALESKLSPKYMETYDTANFYHFVHGLGWAISLFILSSIKSNS